MKDCHTARCLAGSPSPYREKQVPSEGGEIILHGSKCGIISSHLPPCPISMFGWFILRLLAKDLLQMRYRISHVLSLHWLAAYHPFPDLELFKCTSEFLCTFRKYNLLNDGFYVLNSNSWLDKFRAKEAQKNPAFTRRINGREEQDNLKYLCPFVSSGVRMQRKGLINFSVNIVNICIRTVSKQEKYPQKPCFSQEINS